MIAARSRRRAASTLEWLLVGGITLASMTEAFAGTILALGRGDIIGDVHVTPDEFAWLDMSYTALKLIGFAFAPWLLTRAEPRTVLIAATLAMGLACAGAATSTQIEVLIGLRAIQGLAGAIVLVSGQAILFWTFPAERQPVLQAVLAMGAVVVPATVAPAVQGWMLDERSWTWIFYGILPLAMAAAGLTLMADPARLRSGRPRPLDRAGLALFAVAASAVTYALSQGSRWDWFEESRIVWAGIVGGGALGLFAFHQRRWARPALFDFTVFRTDDFTFAFFVSFVAGAALFGSAYLIPSFAVAVLGFTPTEAGGLLLSSSVPFAGALLLAGLLIRARNIPPVATVPFGILLIMTAMWLLSGSSKDSGADDMMPAILLRGLGLGFLFLSITLIAFGKLSPGRIAFGIGLFSIGRQLGGLIGVAGLQTFIDHQTAANQAVLAAALSEGSPALAERLAATAASLAARGMEAGAAAKAAASLLGRSAGGQSAVIAFDAAFTVVALLFVAAAPVLIGLKIALARTAARRGLAKSGARS